MKLTLKTARIHRNMNQSDIAKELGVYQETYSNWESGKSPIKQINRLAISNVLDIPVSNIEWPDTKTQERSN